ncbi:hypothetical protein V7O62_05365 [Methanolobus sp. ZRKC2]|uniref:hypothetical protein n=1 Tax=Methanolobus sp. ZRKC2 TaxID=3125783 RepID=UPI0032545C9C
MIEDTAISPSLYSERLSVFIVAVFRNIIFPLLSEEAEIAVLVHDVMSNVNVNKIKKNNRFLCIATLPFC